MIVGSIVDWGKLGEAAYVSGAFGIGVLLVAAFAVVASLRAQDARRAGSGVAIVLDVATGLFVLAIGAAIVFAIYIMTQK